MTTPCEMKSALLEIWQNKPKLTDDEEVQLCQEYTKRFNCRRCVFDDCQETVRMTEDEEFARFNQQSIDMNEYQFSAECNLCLHHYEIVKEHKVITRENINSYIDSHSDLSESKEFVDVDKKTISLYDYVLRIFASRRHNDCYQTEKIFHHRSRRNEFRVVSFNDLMYQLFVNGMGTFDDLEELELSMISVTNAIQSKIMFHIPDQQHKLDIFFKYWRNVTLYMCGEGHYPKDPCDVYNWLRTNNDGDN